MSKNQTRQIVANQDPSTRYHEYLTRISGGLINEGEDRVVVGAKRHPGYKQLVKFIGLLKADDHSDKEIAGALSTLVEKVFKDQEFAKKFEKSDEETAPVESGDDETNPPEESPEAAAPEDGPGPPPLRTVTPGTKKELIDVLRSELDDGAEAFVTATLAYLENEGALEVTNESLLRIPLHKIPLTFLLFESEGSADEPAKTLAAIFSKKGKGKKERLLAVLKGLMKRLEAEDKFEDLKEKIESHLTTDGSSPEGEAPSKPTAPEGSGPKNS